MTHWVVSVGDTRLFAGIGLGVAGARKATIVVLVEELRFTFALSASVPVLTDQRSTPHCANRVEGASKRTTPRNNKLWRTRGIIHSPIPLEDRRLLLKVVASRA